MGTGIAGRFIEARLGKPSLIRETSRLSFQSTYSGKTVLCVRVVCRVYHLKLIFEIHIHTYIFLYHAIYSPGVAEVVCLTFRPPGWHCI